MSLVWLSTQVRFGHGRPRLGETDGERPEPVGRGAAGAACGPPDVDRPARRRRRVGRTVRRRGRGPVRFAAQVDEDGGGRGRGRLHRRRTVFRQRHATAFAGGAVSRAAGAVRHAGRRLPSDAVRPPGDGRGGRHGPPPGRPAPVAGRGGVAAGQDGPGRGPMVSGPVGRQSRGQASGRS